MAINLIDVGATANDGTGDPIRSAFQTVNENFDFINGGLFAGTESTLISAIGVNSGYIVSNTYVLANTYVNADSIVGNTVTSYGNLYVTQGGAYIVGNVRIFGNLTVTGSQTASENQQTSSSVLKLHYSPVPLSSDDGQDIGLTWQYYDAIEKTAFLGWQNSTGTLVYLDQTTEVANVITAGTPGNVQFGSLTLSNTTASTSNVTGALQVAGGVGIQGNLYTQSNLFVGNNASVGNLTIRGYHVGSLNFAAGDTIFINGSPVQTAASAFNGGTIGLATVFSDLTQSTSVSTGAVTIAGGLGVSGNIWASNIHVANSGNIRGNIQGNVITSAQPFIRSLGTLTGLSVQGQINSRNIVPETNLTYSLGSSTSTRWAKIWAFDADFSGALVLAGDITSTANINVNRTTVAGINTTTAIAEIFNTNATTVRIGSAGTTEFASNIQATSTTTGAVVVSGGVSLSNGNLYIGGSAGQSITATGNVTINSGALTVNSSNGQSIAATGNITIISGNIMPNVNGVANIGSPGLSFNTVHAVATSAKYADLAEKYVSDSDYEVGTVVIFGGEYEITTTNEFADPRVAGVISENPAYLMNNAIEGLPVALRGRVFVRVTGPVNKGDLLVTSTTPGYARSVGRDNGYFSAVFAKSLVQDSSNGTKIIEAVII